MTKISFWLPSSGYPDSNSCKIVTVITLVVWKVKEKQSLSVRSCFQPIISSSKVKLVLKMSIFSTNPLFGLLFWTHQTSPWEMVDGWSLLNLVCSHQRVWNSKRLFWLFLGVFLYCKGCYLLLLIEFLPDFKGALSGLRFYLKSYFCSQDILVFVLTLWLFIEQLD